MNLSDRLYTIYKMVYYCDTVADVGCDHGYLSMALIEGGVAKRAIAMDINKGPLDSAVENIKGAGLSERIECRLSDGLEKLKPGEAEVICICGMGGQLITDILKANLDVAKQTKCLILEPQSKPEILRQFLIDNGFVFDYEQMVTEAGKFYPAMRVKYLPKQAKKLTYSRAEITFGPYLCNNWDEVFLDYITTKTLEYEGILEELKKALKKDEVNEGLRKRIALISDEIEMIAEVNKSYIDLLRDKPENRK